MRTRNSNFPNNSTVTIPRRRNRGRAPNIVEPELRTIIEVAPMAERTMEELLRAPTEGYGEAIVLPEINADHFEIKTNLLQLVQASPFHGYERENPHAHINSFKRITSTLRFRDVPNDVIKLMMFPYSLEGAAKVWYEKEPPNSILTWEDLVTKFVNQFFPPSKTTHLKNEISRFTQKFEETFSEAWERFKEMLRACPYHGFTELTQVDTFYNGLNENDQDSLNAATGWGKNLMNTTSRECVSKTDERIDKLADQISTLVEIVSKKVVTPAPVKAVEEICVTCSGPHAWYNCPNTDNNQSSVCAATDLRFDISFADALLLMPRFAPTIKSLLMNKEKLLELAKIQLNENYSAMLLKKIPEKLGDPGKFLIPFDPRVPLILGRSFLRTCRALIEVYEGDLILRDGDERLIFHVNKHPQKHANESIKMINFIDVSCEDSFGEVLRLKKSNHFLSVRDELALLDPFPPGNEDVDVEAELREIELLLNHDPSTNFSPTIMIDPNLEKFIDEPVLACLPPPGDDESFLKEDVQKENLQVYSNPLFEFDDNYNSSNINPLFKEMLEDVKSKDSNVSNFNEPVLLNTPFFDEDECFDPGGNIDEIDAFLAIEVSTNIEEGYYDSEGDVFYLESLLSDDTTHNLSPEVFFDHEPQCFKDESELDTLENMVKVFDPGI
ncbi:reverse transcriptase domain-containing protein [Tanacetum coccineum]